MDSKNTSLNRILVAFSGGADSSALALMLKQLGFDLVLGHVDHQMRPSSAHDAARCVELAKGWRLPIEVARVVVRPATEAEARRVRYAALEKIADELGCVGIATGHTLDDDAETVAMRQQ
ncbi:MAG: tRNA lysidine(34) synthetase, partial [Actinomycetota bacterium]